MVLGFNSEVIVTRRFAPIEALTIVPLDCEGSVFSYVEKSKVA